MVERTIDDVDAADLTESGVQLVIYLCTASLARLANEGVRIAFILAAEERGLGIQFGGMLVGAFLLPNVLAAPLVGAVADRIQRKSLLYTLAFIVYGVVIAAAGLMMGHVSSSLVLILAFLGGCIGPLLTGGLTSLLKEIVPSERLSRAYGLDAATYNIAAISAPAVLAFVAATRSPIQSILLLSVCMALAAIGMTLLRFNRRVLRDNRPNGSPFRDVSVLWTSAPLRATTLAAGLGSLGAGALPIAAALLANSSDRINAGVLLSAVAIGALAGALFYALWPFGERHPQHVVLGGTLLTAIPFMAQLVMRDYVEVILLFALSGLIGGPLAACQFAVRERYSPEHVRTQVFTIAAGLKISISALGAAMAGLLGPAGITILMGAISASFLVAGVIGTVTLRWPAATHVIPEESHGATSLT